MRSKVKSAEALVRGSDERFSTERVLVFRNICMLSQVFLCMNRKECDFSSPYDCNSYSSVYTIRQEAYVNGLFFYYTGNDNDHTAKEKKKRASGWQILEGL